MSSFRPDPKTLSFCLHLAIVFAVHKKLTATGSTIAIAAMALTASPSLGVPTGPSEASDTLSDSPRPDVESSPSLHPSQMLGISPAVRSGSGQRRSSGKTVFHFAQVA
jgi:hypothetical protein